MKASSEETDGLLLAAAEAFGTEERIAKLREELVELVDELDGFAEGGSAPGLQDELIDVIITARVLWERFAITGESDETFAEALARKARKLEEAMETGR